MKKIIIFHIVILLFGCTDEIIIDESIFISKQFSISMIYPEDNSSNLFNIELQAESEFIKEIYNWVMDNKSGWQHLYHTPVGAGIFIKTENFFIQFTDQLVYINRGTDMRYKSINSSIYEKLETIISNGPK